MKTDFYALDSIEWLHCSDWLEEDVSAVYEINVIKAYLGSKEQTPKTATFKDVPDLLPWPSWHLSYGVWCDNL